MEEPVLLQVENGTAQIILNRPEKRNAVNKDLLHLLCKYVRQVAHDDTIRAVLLTGNGKSFCAGLDVSAIGEGGIVQIEGEDLDFGSAIAEGKKPVIGAINGHAVTGGFEIALNCDFLIASERASFRDTHVLLGIHPALGMSQLLQQAIGQRRAKQISFTGQPIDAETALKWGLVNEVVPHDDLIPRAKQIAADIGVVNQKMLQVMKDLIEFRNEAPHAVGCSRERDSFGWFMNGTLFSSGD